MGNIKLKAATIKDKPLLVHMDYSLNKIEHIALKREEKITKSILNNECFIILSDTSKVGFILFDYRFFDNGWIELIIIDEKHQGHGIGSAAIKMIGRLCKTTKIFTSTNQSNEIMQKALNKAGFTFAGKIHGLDEGDPELFYFKNLSEQNPS